VERDVTFACIFDTERHLSQVSTAKSLDVSGEMAARGQFVKEVEVDLGADESQVCTAKEKKDCNPLIHRGSVFSLLLRPRSRSKRRISTTSKRN
jgi:hypothetical protein